MSARYDPANETAVRAVVAGFFAKASLQPKSITDAAKNPVWQPTAVEHGASADAVRARIEPPASPSALSGMFQSVFVLEPNTIYPPAPTTLVQRGAHVIGDYDDGSLCCNRVNDKLQCRWIQTDTDGRAILGRRPNGKVVGRWGYEPSDSNAGTWTLIPTAAPGKPRAGTSR